MKGSKLFLCPAVGFIFAASVVTAALAQKSGSSQPQAPTAPAPTAPAPSTPAPPPPSRSQPQFSELGKMTLPVPRGPGRVVMEDSSPPPEPVEVYAASCPRAGPIGRTDSKGNITLRSFEGVPSAKGSGGIASIDPFGFAGCLLRTRISGYRSDPVRVDIDADLPTIVLHPILGVEGLTTSVTSLAAPRNAREAFWKAEEAIENKQWDKARPELEKAVKIYPKYALAWYFLGLAHQSAGDLAQARNAYEQSIQADPRFIKPYLELTKIHNKEQNWQGLVDVTAAVIKLDPSGYPAAYVFSAMGQFRLGNLDAAEASAREAIKLDRGHVYPEAEYALGAILGTRGDYKGAAEHFRNYLQFAPNAPNAETVRKQLAKAEELAAAQPSSGQAAPPQPSP